MTTTAPIPKLPPYRKGGEIDYESLDFIPDEFHKLDDAIQEERQILELHTLFRARFTGSYALKDTLVTSAAIICYDPNDLNVHIAPDICLAFGVDRDAIVNRRIYLPWEAGKPPDWVLEVATPSTARADVGRKVSTYETIGVPEYWLFDPTGGELYGFPLAGYRLESGIYRPVALTDEPDGITKGYSEILRLSLCWDNGMPRLYSPPSGAYIRNWKEERDYWEAKRNALKAKRNAERAAWESRRIALKAENDRLREKLRRLQSGE